MTMKVFTAIITVVMIVCFIQISTKALNNNGFGEVPYMDAIKSGVRRWASDVDGPLSTYAITNAYYTFATDNNPNERYIWYAYGRAAYRGDNAQYKSDFDCRAFAKGFTDTNSGKNWAGTFWKTAHMRVEVSPRPDEGGANINDCEAHGDASGKDPSTEEEHHSRAEIPFPNINNDDDE